MLLLSASLAWSPPTTRVGAIRAGCGPRCAAPALAADWALLFDCDGVLWVANKRFEISKFRFKIPRARTSELQGSFSAVSKPNFATKYSLESSRRDLHNALLCTVL